MRPNARTHMPLINHQKHAPIHCFTREYLILDYLYLVAILEVALQRDEKSNLAHSLT